MSICESVTSKWVPYRNLGDTKAKTIYLFVIFWKWGGATVPSQTQIIGSCYFYSPRY